MPNLPSVSYIIGQFEDAIYGRKTQKGGKSFRKLKYMWSYQVEIGLFDT